MAEIFSITIFIDSKDSLSVLEKSLTALLFDFIDSDKAVLRTNYILIKKHALKRLISKVRHKRKLALPYLHHSLTLKASINE